MKPPVAVKKLAAKKSLMKKTSSSRSGPYSRSEYLSQFRDLVKGGMSQKQAASKVKSIALDDMARELEEAFNN